MNMEEYLRVKDFTYLEYCDYLQNKYGIGLADYMTKSYYRNPKCSRTKEGLYAHHKKEDTCARLSKKEVAMKYPFEYQQKENIVYCDYLEHLLLHILICKYPAKEKPKNEIVGIRGILCFFIPELNDVYNGWETQQEWRKKCHNRIKDDVDVYLLLLKQFYYDRKEEDPNFDIAFLYSNGKNLFASYDPNNELHQKIKNICEPETFITKNKTAEKPVKCIELNRIFPNISVAAKELHLSRHRLSKALHNDKKIAGEYHWMYVDIDNN